MAMKYGKCGHKDCACFEFDPCEQNGKVCDCGHKRCFHQPPSSIQRKLVNGTKSVSEMVGPVFEQEVNRHLQDHLPSCLPKTKMSDIRKRQIENDNGTTLLEIDSFAYVFEDDLMYGTELASSGFFLIEPKSCGRMKSIAIEKKMAEKYIIGESYSGQSQETVIEKVNPKDG